MRLGEERGGEVVERGGGKQEGEGERERRDARGARVVMGVKGRKGKRG